MNRWLAGLTIMVASLAGCRLANGREDAVMHSPAIAHMTDSISRFPNNAALYLQRAVLLSQQNEHEMAYSDYHKAWELHPDEATALALTSNLFMLGKEKEATTFLEKCMQQYPANIEFPRRLGEAYQQSGNSGKAMLLYDKIIQANPTSFEAYYEKGILMAQLHDTTRAINALEKSFALQPLQLSGVSLANLYAETKNPKVLLLCDELIKADSAKELTDPVFIKGIYYANIHLSDKALEQFEECIRRDWKFTEAYIEKGIILYHQHNIDEALKTFALAARVSNTYPDAYYWMGRCFETSGKINEARTNYYRALALDRNFTEAREALKRLQR